MSTASLTLQLSNPVGKMESPFFLPAGSAPTWTEGFFSRHPVNCAEEIDQCQCHQTNRQAVPRGRHQICHSWPREAAQCVCWADMKYQAHVALVITQQMSVKSSLDVTDHTNISCFPRLKSNKLQKLLLCQILFGSLMALFKPHSVAVIWTNLWLCLCRFAVYSNMLVHILG